MSAQDREAFEAWATATGYDPHQHSEVIYDNAWKAWTAARDHYAPSLPETEAAKIAAMVCAEIDYDEDNHADFEDVGLFVAQNWGAYGETAAAIIRALKAAGVRFAEEA